MRPALWLGWALLLALAVLAFWQFQWMGADFSTPISHGINEDWDWQLTLYEVSRRTILEFRELPAWNPYTQGGVPLLANPESPFLYPPFLLILALGTHAGLKLWVLLHLVALVAACWWAGRELGLGPVAAHGAALLALCSAFIPEFVAYGHIMYLPLCWLPLAWLAMRRGRWAWAGLCLAMTVLAGGHHLLLYGALWLSTDVIFRRVSPRVALLVGGWMGVNLLLLGQHWAAWPLGLAGVAILGWALWSTGRQHLGALPLDLALLGAAFVVALLLLGPKLATVPALWERAERLSVQRQFSIADDYTPLLAIKVLWGLVARPSGHEGQNVFYSPLPLLLALPGVWIALRRAPAAALTGLLFLCLGWGGSTPVNLLQVLHRVPPFDHIRVVERYSLVWTLFLGWFAAFGGLWLWGLGRWRWGLRPLLLAAVGWHLWLAVPAAAWHYHIGPGLPHEIPPAQAFVQVDDPLTNWEAVRANRGKPRCWTTAWLEDPGPVLAREDAGYSGEVRLLPDGDAGGPVTLHAAFTPNRVAFEAPTAGWVVVNQNAFRGWHIAGIAAEDRDGLLAAHVPPGKGEFVYRPPGLLLGLVAAGLALVLILFGVLAPVSWRRLVVGAPSPSPDPSARCSGRPRGKDRQVDRG